jgi:hypothetical protein
VTLCNGGDRQQHCQQECQQQRHEGCAKQHHRGSTAGCEDLNVTKTLNSGGTAGGAGPPRPGDAARPRTLI